MRIIFAGTPEFARVALAQLHAAGFEIPLVLTQPDRPAGRGLKLQASPVKQFALTKGLPVAQPRSLRLDGKYPDDAAAARVAIEAARADAMVVAAYGLILPQWVLDMPRLGCFNIHASLLPRWRGAAPIHRAIEAGDLQTGVTIMQMDAGLDTGDMLLAEALPITPQDSTGRLHDRLALLGGRLIVEALELAACGGLRPVKQPETGVRYARKIDKLEAVVDWTQPAEVIGRRIRAFDPFPGAHTSLGGETIKLWCYEIESDSRPSGVDCGTILSVNGAGVRVACGQGALRLTELQRAGGKRLNVADFLRGFELAPGMTFGK
ncbi:MAG: methionyl-tRNA formyltransferase [Polaromonas sp.]|nr:methionyl-tRNA formyltransferase [Polaromonas sp.]